jgi:nicotinamide-nucleotide amidase
MDREPAVHDIEDLAAALAERLDGRTLACAESCTAGRIAATLAGAGGAADWLRGGLVAYQTATKRALLGVAAPSVFSEQAAIEMADGAARLLDADVVVATTGVLGDTPEEGVAPGTVIVATSVDGDVRVGRCHVDGDTPEERCAAAVAAALRALVDHLPH